ncbi:MAG: ABC transporter permease [Elusimicrobiota bacterium]
MFKKEFLQLKRDKRSLAFFMLMPAVWLVVFGYALTSDIKHIPTAVFDEDGHFLSRELVAVFQNSEYFDIQYQVTSEEKISYLLDKGQVKVGLIIPGNFSRNCLALKGAQVQILIDGSDPNTAGSALNVGNACVKFLAEQISGQIKIQPIEVQPRIWYNPELRSANFMIPGLIGLILQMLIPIMTGVGIVKERERGTIEQLITTPIKAWELILGKLLPYMTIAIVVVAVVTLVGVEVFMVPIKGNIFFFALVVCLFLLLCLSLGLFFSTIAQNQLQAFQMVVLTGVPSILLSGLLFPREAMPKIIYYLGYLLPLTYFINLVRGIFLKGLGLFYLWDSLLVLLIFEIILMTLSIKKFKKKLG